MKLTLPPLEIGETEGFSDEKDIFGRKRYGENLLSLINKTDDELVIAIDAPWGQGKSTFIKMWRGHLLNEGFQSIYFDAFENDYQADPFLAISSEIYSLIPDENNRNDFKEKAVKALSVISTTALKAGLSGVTGGLINIPAGTSQDITKAASDLYADYLEEKIINSKVEKQSIVNFKTHLEGLSKTLADGNKLIFVIDELDRCKPKFALAIIESIKHLFSTKNLCFVLVVNRGQLEESVRHEYGSNIDASGYLTKFITLWNTLPKDLKEEELDTFTYLLKCSESMNFKFDDFNQELLKFFQDINELFELSLRDIERALTNFSLLINTHTSNQSRDYNLIYLCYWILSVMKLKTPDDYSIITNKYLDHSNINSKLNNLPNREYFNEVTNLSFRVMDFMSRKDLRQSNIGGYIDVNSRLMSSLDWYRKNIGLSGLGRILDTISLD